MEAQRAPRAGLRRTPHACALPRLASVKRPRSSPPRVAATRFALDATARRARALKRPAGLAPAGTTRAITTAIALQHLGFAPLERSRCTHRARSARRAGLRRTR